MKTFKFILAMLLGCLAGAVFLSACCATTFRDVRTGPLGEYLTGYLWPRFMEFFMIFGPYALLAGAIALATTFLVESLTPPRR